MYGNCHNTKNAVTACDDESPIIIVSTKEHERDTAWRNYLAVEAKKDDGFFQSVRGVQCFLPGEHPYQFGARIAYGLPQAPGNFLLDSAI